MADTLDVLTLAEAQAAVRVSASAPADRLEQAITACSRSLDALVGPVVQRTVTNETHDGGCHLIQLESFPVVSVTTATEYDETTATVLSAETNASKPADAYLLETVEGRLRRRSGNADARFPVGRRNVVVTYLAGRAAATASVDAVFKHAASLWLKIAWRAEQTSMGQVDGYEVPQLSFPTFAVPKAVREALAHEWRDTPGIA